MSAGPGSARKKHYASLTHIKRANKHWSEQVEGRAYWFDKAELEFWGTRVHLEVIGGRFFVASNKPGFGGEDDPRRYQVYRVDDDGRIETVDRPGWHPAKSEWPGYETAEAAKLAAQVAASEEK